MQGIGSPPYASGPDRGVRRARRAPGRGPAQARARGRRGPHRGLAFRHQLRGHAPARELVPVALRGAARARRGGGRHDPGRPARRRAAPLGRLRRVRRGARGDRLPDSGRRRRRHGARPDHPGPHRLAPVQDEREARGGRVGRRDLRRRRRREPRGAARQAVRRRPRDRDGEHRGEARDGSRARRRRRGRPGRGGPQGRADRGERGPTGGRGARDVRWARVRPVRRGARAVRADRGLRHREPRAEHGRDRAPDAEEPRGRRLLADALPRPPRHDGGAASRPLRARRPRRARSPAGHDLRALGRPPGPRGPPGPPHQQASSCSTPPASVRGTHDDVQRSRALRIDARGPRPSGLHQSHPHPGAGDPAAPRGQGRDRPGPDRHRQDGRLRAAHGRVRGPGRPERPGACADAHARALHPGDPGAARVRRAARA